MADFILYNEHGDEVTESEAYEMYDDMLNEICEIVTVAGIEFFPSDILRGCDPIAYRVGFHDYADGMVSDGVWFETDPTADEDE